MPGLPLSFQPLDAAAVAAFTAATRRRFLAELLAAGEAPADAEEHAATTFERLLPAGMPAAGQLLGGLIRDGLVVGTLWLGPAGSDPTRWWVYDIVIDESRRGHGLGREAMLLAEELARQRGASMIGLNVFAANAVARSLYTSLGYQETSVQMNKPL